MNPYENLSPAAFWRPAIADRSMFEVADLWTPKYRIKIDAPVAAYGSCFAQHIGRALHQNGYNWLRTETAPTGMTEESAAAFNYGVFSCRTGNIYTTSLLHQWCSWAVGESQPPEEYWQDGDRVIDPFRPNVEPDGFASVDEMRTSREATIRAFRRSIEKASVFVFTLGLTECWRNKQGGYEYPMCPGTVAGEFDESLHEFVNMSSKDVRSNLNKSIKMMRQINPGLRFLLTVSPVPLTATCSGNHVVVATMYSKSVLRSVAGEIAAENQFVDYFPSYEIINSPVFGGVFFGPNKRSVTQHGVNFVMSHLFGSLDKFLTKKQRMNRTKGSNQSFDEVCEEVLLDAFAK